MTDFDIYDKRGDFEVTFPILNGEATSYSVYTVDPRYLEFQGTLWNTSRYAYLDISELQN